MMEVTLITDRRRSRGRSTEEVVTAAIAGGVDRVQVREKDLPTRDLVALVRAIVAQRGGAAVLVNDRIDVALAAGAQGVHLGARTIPLAQARRIAPGLEIGYSAHYLEEALAAQRDGASFVTYSPVFETASEGGRHLDPRGLARLAEVCHRLQIPVHALGGVTASRIPGVLAAGARGVAVVSAITQAEDVERAAREMVRLARSPDPIEPLELVS
jgi:thiamine-phosphate pyrophosphorylase